ncbi:helix-turn-helix domain-containing protein [Acidimangrovimonas sediminis]|uniref:helix-turn-helix domain-containing protein n=1 Tax=Acidimangrovimonas sediminis TaxID=2056283 RepID=UPI000C8089C2|nr:helix-turn-helix domain-containing protein [Acidimangrovimonas sediminis]
MARNDFPVDRERHARIKYQLDLRGLSLADIARKANVGASAVSVVSLGRSRSANIEKVLAEALGTTAEELFPERYPSHSEQEASMT